MAAWSRLGLTILVVGNVAVVAISIWATTPGLARSGLPAFLRELGILLFAPVPILLVMALLLRARIATLALITLIVVGGWLYGPQLTPRASAATEGARIRVLSLNTGALRGFKKPESIIQTVRALDPDLVCLIEAPADTLNTIGAALHATYPHQVGGNSIFVFSRFPLTDGHREILQNGTKSSLQVSVEVDHRLVTFTAVHLHRADAYRGLRSGLGPLMRTVRTFSTDERDTAVTELTAALREEGGTRILVGDLNMTPTSRAYSILHAELQDAFQGAGWGLGHTYPTTLQPAGLNLPLPLVRIDYIFHSPDLIATQAWVGPDSGSDHLPMIADLAFR